MNTRKILIGLATAALCLMAGAPASQAQVLNASIEGAKAKSTKFASVTLATSSTVVATNTTTLYTTATFYGYSAVSRTAAPTANGGTVYIGFADGNHSVTNLVDTIAAGSWLKITAPPGTKYDLKDVYFNGSTGDKVQIVYEQ